MISVILTIAIVVIVGAPIVFALVSLGAARHARREAESENDASS